MLKIYHVRETRSAAGADPGCVVRGIWLILALLMPGVGWAQGIDALDVARAELTRQRRALGLEASDIAEWRVTDRVRDARTGRTRIYLCQQYQGIDVFNALANTTVGADGRVRAFGSRFVRNLHARVNTTTPRLSRRQALDRVASHLDLDARVVVERSARDVPVELRYVDQPTAVRLAWSIVLRLPERGNWWHLLVDTQTGAILGQRDWMKHDSYRVYALPLANPDDGGRTLEVDPADLTGASPLGWHDLNGVAGADATDTAGNAVFAQEDVNADDTGGFSPDGGAGLVFDFDAPIDLDLNPENYQSSAITNLFYWNSLLHDVLHRYGFDEAAGNFQLVNFTANGFANDPVFADAQDGASFNNATFATPPDGGAPVMEMYLWFTGNLAVNSPAPIVGNYAVLGGRFGPPLTTPGFTGDLELASPADACAPLGNNFAGNIALIDRGNCLFVDKVLAAQTAGASAVIVVNNVVEANFPLGGATGAITIPSAMLGLPSGNLIKAQLGVGVNVTVDGNTFDGGFANDIIVHEYAHGLSTRLTGGPAINSCLDSIQSGGMGEGWGDWLGLALTVFSGDDRSTARGLGTFVVGQTFDQEGIRRFPYSTDVGVNPLGFDDVGDILEVHAVGEVWAVALWDLLWNLIEKHGFDADVHQGSGGNNLAIQLVIDGMKDQVCEPTFLQARDAILGADVAGAQSPNKCRLWTAFAKRGMGVSAATPGSTSVSTSEAFDLPPECSVCGDVNDDEGFDLIDVVVVRRAQALASPAMTAQEKCNTIGSADLGDANADGVPNDCQPDDAIAMQQQLAAQSPGISPVCGPIVGLFR